MIGEEDNSRATVANGIKARDNWAVFMRTAKFAMLPLALVAVVLVLAGAASAQAVDSTAAPPSQPATPRFDFDPAGLPSLVRAPALDAQTIKPNESMFSGLELGGSTLNFEGDRRPPDTRFGAETFEPGTLMSRKPRKLGPNYFGLSIKKSLE
jgi:hypothetical protein